MKKIKKTQANGFYIFRGDVAANSNFIETFNEAKQFLIYANYFLNKYMTVYDYNITRHGWQIVVKLNSIEEICPAPEEMSGFDTSEQEVWRIVSERMRLFLSIYVKTVNRMRGRSGTLVHSSYERYYFETLGEAKAVVDSLRQQSFRMYKRKPKYRGLKSHYKIPEKLGKGSIFLCSKEVVKRVKKRCGGAEDLFDIQCLSKFKKFVLPFLVESTIKLHTNQNTPSKYPLKT